MSKQAVLDTNVLVALLDQRDRLHTAASVLATALEAAQISIIYLDCVLSETIGVMARRAEEQKRSEQFPELLNALEQLIPQSEIVWTMTNLQNTYGEVLQLVRQSKGTMNFNDAVIALACKELQALILVSFDSDFDQISWLNRIFRVEDVANQ